MSTSQYTIYSSMHKCYRLKQHTTRNSRPFFSQNIYADFTVFYHPLFIICKQLVI